jgi:malate dehydrogenase (oxaloacetate-decarboxylating)
MAASTPRPVIMPLSNPTSRMEAMPADVLAWSDGKALVATGSPVAPVEYDGTTYRIGQSNNVLVFPGIGRGVIIAGARRVTKNMLVAAAKAVASKTDPTGLGAPLLPDMQNLQEISTAVAAAVYHAAVQDGVATKKHHDLVRAILDTIWVPEYQTGEEIR